MTALSELMYIDEVSAAGVGIQRFEGLVAQEASISIETLIHPRYCIKSPLVIGRRVGIRHGTCNIWRRGSVSPHSIFPGHVMM
jgi:hypothetical protein